MAVSCWLEVVLPQGLPINRLRTILLLGLPITGGMLSQSLINLIDTAMVGRLGEESLAAIGAANYALFVSFALINGLSVAVQSRVARFYGCGNRSQILEPVSSGVMAALVIGLPLTIVLFLCSGLIISTFGLDSSVAPLALDYFRIRVLSLPAAMLMLTFRGFWNGYNTPWNFLRILIVTHVVNAVASYGLIFGVGNIIQPLALSGAAIGTLIAMYTGALINTLATMRIARRDKLPNSRPDQSRMLQLYRQAWPDSAQQTLFALGMCVFFALVARMGNDAMAITHVIINVSLLLILPGLGLGMAATTLINHALGAGDTHRAWRWGWDVVTVAMVLLTLLSLPLLFMPEAVLGLFLPDNNRLIAEGVQPLQLAGAGLIIDSISLVLTQALLGTGSNKTVLRIRFVTLWQITLPLTWLAGVYFGLGLSAVWCIQILQRLLSSVAYCYIWQKRGWHKGLSGHQAKQKYS
ncbi:MATE family efflux transporter [Sansalvadorimonas sp. 2012CJ34-2]|uniref:Multidrug-efflux transporter n=1 Tax=Parendozoicomonas callyspongiae TaxID=2942213 RepID=A0ABT0PGE1_9GAMM|nr:MATE family efflux transporter [Sansalvadorimonas sp. 2012CJ34-2]MCL6269827.1 MATE family efflux transporter [Sansalvadorimonas sp. 2012CJ34-2]